MTFEEAVRKSIKSYLSGTQPTKLIEASGKEVKYTLKFFEDLEKELIGASEPKKGKGKGKKDD
jgi:hypothetical protein